MPFKNTGRRLDPETGLYYYRARYYSASLGRFLQTDPIGYADQMNLYGYVGNDPVNLVDPSGKWLTFYFGWGYEGAADPVKAFDDHPRTRRPELKGKPSGSTGIKGPSRSEGLYITFADKDGNLIFPRWGRYKTEGSATGVRGDVGIQGGLVVGSESRLEGEAVTTTLDVGPATLSETVTTDGEIVGYGIGGTSPLPGGSVATTKTTVTPSTDMMDDIGNMDIINPDSWFEQAGRCGGAASPCRP